MFGTRKTQFRRLFESAPPRSSRASEQPTIAMVNGHAVGGWGPALACDFRLAATEAQFWIPEVDLGVPLGVASTARFVRLVGPARAKEIILECRRYSAAEALAFGLVTRAVPGAELAGAVREFAARLAAKPFRPLAEPRPASTPSRTGIPDVQRDDRGPSRTMTGRHARGHRSPDLSRIIAGPYCAMLLGDLGADVVKLERPGRGDDMRSLRGGSGMSAIFAAVNRNKRGIAVDLRRPEGTALAFELARRADVIVENFITGGADELGLGYEKVRAVNPAVVYASVSGFGPTGPYARRPGYNSIAMGVSGVMAPTGMPGHAPTRPGGSIADLAASFLTFGAVNAALVRRFLTGEGQHVDVNLLASMLAMLPDPVANYF